MRDIEHRIQVSCVKWFRLQYRDIGLLLWSTPNGSARDLITGKRLKDEGVVAGVADLFLAVARGGYHGLFIEMKTEKGKQSPAQIEFQKRVEAQGYKYVVCRSLDEFMMVINEYLSQ